MAFNSYILLWFVPLAFAGWWTLKDRLTARNLWIIAAGFVFYGWWDWRFLFLIMAVIGVSYGSGLALARIRSRKGRRAVVWAAAVVDLGILGLFKYFDFFVKSLVKFGALFGVMLDNVTLDLVLPVGISFYTFQGLAYTIDVYRRDVEPCRDPVSFAAFISFFPQLVAGPIERAANLLPQFRRPHSFDYALAVDGCRQILWGLFKKVIVADHCARTVNIIFKWSDQLPWYILLLGAFLFTIQIYGDFSGYSDIAIGLAKLFGIRLRPNFITPFHSKNPKEFWTRWHISLSSWFRDYLYIPLGGNRKGKLRKAVNLILVFLVSGLWHGAAWTFAAWGAVHGLAQLPFINKKRERRAVKRGMAAAASAAAATFLFVILAFIPFRANSIGEAWTYVSRMFTLAGGMDSWDYLHPGPAIFWSLVLLVWDYAARRQPHGLAFTNSGPMRCGVFRWTVYYVIALMVILMAGQAAEFIYFQF